MNVADLVSRFETCSLSKTEWTHEAHLVVALWYVSSQPDFWSAVCCLRAGIISHNRSVGTPNTGVKGYHETITVFWAREVYDFYETRKDLTLDEIFECMRECRTFFETDYILRFYDASVLKSSQARAMYVPRKE